MVDRGQRGQVGVQVRVGFSANNVTYALLGETLRYWDLYALTAAGSRA